MPTKQALVSVGRIDQLIYAVRGQRVMLDRDLALLYGVETRVLNQAVRRNRERFPAEFVFALSSEETSRISQFVISQLAPEAATLRSQIVISKPGRGGRRYRPYAFSEHGALMAATVLSSPQAVKMSLFIIRAFVKMREQQAANAAILKRLAEIDRTLFTHDATLRDIYRKLRPLLEPPPEPPRKEIGFHVKEDALPYRVKRKTARS